MPHVYLSSESYPELRDIGSRWARNVIWWRAFRRAFRHLDFWSLLLTQAGIVAAFIAADVLVVLTVDLRPAATRSVHAVAAVSALLVFGYLLVSWGGDIMRRHLRGVSDVARYACPGCGHSLVGHLDSNDERLRCPECAARTSRETFEPPFPIPREYRVFPPRRR